MEYLGRGDSFWRFSKIFGFVLAKKAKDSQCCFPSVLGVLLTALEVVLIKGSPGNTMTLGDAKDGFKKDRNSTILGLFFLKKLK